MRPSTAKHLRTAAVIAVVLMVFLGTVHGLGLARPLFFALLAAGLVLAGVIGFAPFIVSAAWEHVHAVLKDWQWRRDAGQFHAFAGIQLNIVDDGRHVWLDAESLQRVLRREEAEEVVAARHSERWQRHDEHGLVLRVDTVVQVLGTMRGRDDPRVQRFRRYLERDVLFPASQRRALRQGTRTGPR